MPEQFRWQVVGRHEVFLHVVEAAAVDLPGDTVGARIVFRKVAGLDPDWLRHAVLCHQARAAALGVGAGLAADPTTVPMSSIAVLDQGGQVVLIIRGMTDEATAEILARAMALAPRK